ncbi:MAG TPA: IclR family transcriptional regulator [Ramlibacter sp.]|nr:IclR family transcriptional regulator [Ramlibacter sp.]
MPADLKSLRQPPPAEDATDRKGIQSVEIGVRVVDALAESAEPLPLREIARRSGLSTSQAHRYLAGFMNSGLVTQDRGTQLYELGPRALRWGLAALTRINAVELASDAIKRLSDRLNQTGMVIVWGERGPTCIWLQRAPTLLGTDVGLGTVFPVLGSATGRLFLAYLPRSLTRGLVQAELKALAHDLPEGVPDVEAIVAEVRAAGHSRASGHFVSSISALAAPVFDHQGEVVLSLTMLARTPELQRREAEIVQAVCGEAQAVSQMLGYGTRAARA